MSDTRIDFIRMISRFTVISIIAYGIICSCVHILSKLLPFSGPAILIIGLITFFNYS